MNATGETFKEEDKGKLQRWVASIDHSKVATFHVYIVDTLF